MGLVSREQKVPNLISFDIEGFIEATHDIMEVPQKYLSKAEEKKAEAKPAKKAKKAKKAKAEAATK